MIIESLTEPAHVLPSKLKHGLVKPHIEAVPEIQRAETTQNPVITSCQFAYSATNIVQINDQGVKRSAKYIRQKMLQESYTPRTWRTHPLHVCPDDNSDPYNSEATSSSSPSSRSILDEISPNRNKLVLDWIFLISSLNFSFWSEEGTDDRFGIEWFEGWDSLEELKEQQEVEEEKVVHTGYWSLVAALDRAMQEGIPICDPTFYSSPELCPDSLIEHIFRPSEHSIERIPLLRERIEIMRENGRILCKNFNGSFQNLLIHFQALHQGQGSALQLVQMVTRTFPKFRDEFTLDGEKIYIWKRAQILVAEIWAAFYPLSSSSSSSSSSHPPHPIFPSPSGPRIHQLTMFADYRVPQILHHLRILTYPLYLLDILTNGVGLESGSREEVSLRAASVVGVELVRKEIEGLIEAEREAKGGEGRVRKGEPEGEREISSVLIDFYLWDLAKEIEEGKKQVEGIQTEGIVPAHRTRSIWY